MPRNKKYWKRRFGAAETTAYYHHFDLRPIPDLDDEGLAYLLTNVKGVNMLDLNETEITNTSIALLTKLEYVNELRLKGCTEIDNDCIADLNKITSLQFLHVKNTGITIDGILQLTALTKLTTILFSNDDNKDVKEKMLLLKAMLPNCSFAINSIPYIFEEEY
ncbi:hypothetical protein [Ferruginibacter sp.]|nr:hypothetical protein [Ferruginibacter sp.]